MQSNITKIDVTFRSSTDEIIQTMLHEKNLIPVWITKNYSRFGC